MSRFNRATKPFVLSLLFMALATRIVPILGQEVRAARPSPAVRESAIYMCPMHPDVRADRPGNCVKCGMPLVRIVADLESLKSVLTLETTPAAATPGEKVRLRFMLSHPGTGARIKEFNIVHGMPFHLFIVSHG